MKILQIINALTFGGAQVILLDLVKKLLEEGHEVEVLAFRDGPIGKKLRELGCSTRILGESLLDLLAFRKLLQSVKSFQPDLIHSHLFRATFWARMGKLLYPKIPLLTSIHGRESEFFHRCERLSSGLSDHLIFPSRYLRDWYQHEIRAVHKNLTSIIYPGVDILPEAEAQDSSRVVIGTLSRLHPVKGVDLLIKAAGLLRRKQIDFELMIGGDGRQRSELVAMAEQAGIADICRFVGEIDQVKEFISQFTVFVAASRQEAFGIHVCEAMERGIPVVAAKTDGMLEQVEDLCGGLLFESNCAESLAEKLELMLADKPLQQKLRQVARLKVVNTFNRQTALEKHLQLYSEFSYRPRRIHFVISSSELGGGERLALSLMKNLQQLGWKISATCCGSPLHDALREAGIQSSTVGLRLSGAFFAFRLLRDLWLNKPDLVSSHLNKASLIAGYAGKILGIPVISHVHGLNRRLYYAGSNHLIAVSDAVREHLIGQGITSSQISTIKNCVEFKPVSAARTPASPLNICIVAKLHRNKGHEWALRALLSADSPDFRLHIIGDGPERRNLENLCRQLSAGEKVKFYGFFNDPRKLLEKFDVALLPSLGEGIPLSLLEAMSLGIPALATKVGGIPEIVNDGVNGLLVEPENAGQLLEAFKKLTDAKFYSSLSQGALDEFGRLNDFERMIESTAAVFAEFIRE